MTNMFQALLLGSLGLLLCGCGSGLVGTYDVTAVIPESAKGDFDFGRIVFERDGDFVADVSYGGKSREHRGTYSYDENTRRLSFTGHDGRVRTYRAEVCCDNRTCREVHILNDGEKKEWIALLLRR